MNSSIEQRYTDYLLQYVYLKGVFLTYDGCSRMDKTDIIKKNGVPKTNRLSWALYNEQIDVDLLNLTFEYMEKHYHNEGDLAHEIVRMWNNIQARLISDIVITCIKNRPFQNFEYPRTNNARKNFVLRLILFSGIPEEDFKDLDEIYDDWTRNKEFLTKDIKKP